VTLDQWLEEATGTFPCGVRERLAQEYIAHLEDSVAAGGSGEALELFGEPQRMKRSLKKLYVSQERLEQVRKSTRLEWVFLGVASFLTLFNLNSVLKFSGTRFFTHFLIEFILIAVPFLLVWASSQRWEKTRRASFRFSMFSVALSVDSLYGLIFNSPDRSYLTVGLIIAPVMVATLIYTVIEDRRIERTLKIESY
jgi:hypothetical protein